MVRHKVLLIDDSEISLHFASTTLGRARPRHAAQARLVAARLAGLVVDGRCGSTREDDELIEHAARPCTEIVIARSPGDTNDDLGRAHGHAIDGAPALVLAPHVA